MTDTDEIYKLMNEEFMGHKVDSVIITKPLLDNESDGKIWREYAKLKLEKEARFFYDV